MLCPSEPAAENGISVCVSAPSAAPTAAVVVQDFNGGADGSAKAEGSVPIVTCAGGGVNVCCTPVVSSVLSAASAANVAAVDADGDPKLKPIGVVQRGAELTGDSYSSTDSGGAPATVATHYCNEPYCQLKEGAVVVAVVPTQVDGAKLWKCEVCCKQFAQKHHLQTHLLCHSGVKRFECQVCHKAFKQQAHLNTHLLIHEGRRPHRCPHCDHSFLQVTHLKRHLVTHGGSCLPCALCGRRFAFPSDLSAHVAKHHPPPLLRGGGGGGAVAVAAHRLQCEVCERLFQYPSQLRDHMLVHTQVRRFACPDCGMRFMKEHHLRNHLVTHSPVKPFPCPVCGRAFSLKANMERHVLIHEAQRRFGCERCGKRFSQPQTLKMHLVSHADVKPYSCSVCGKGLARAHNLRAHMAIHQTSKPHRCPDCSSTFTLRGNLVRHLKEKHGPAGQASTGGEGTALPVLMVPASPSRNNNSAVKRRKNPPKRLKKCGEGSGEEDGENEDDCCEEEEGEVEAEQAETNGVDERNDRFQDLSGHKYQGLPGSPESARNVEVLQVAAYYPAPVVTQEAPSTEHKPFSLHALQPAPVFASPNCFYGELPSATPAAVGAEEVGARLQALHAAIDDLAGKLGPDHDKVTALHAALDQLVPPSQQSSTAAT